ncbi:uncharacterized protein J7T54_005803 [Emericellopsis cladophorae]|uniref:Uncharacterized protein n=1 Tax=Emericellopsis cladophorae TaxID=2686198 RepID=A0A9P9XXM9_9HYPO|nr:uncharacterized protein J7T54_005803 [Emericellopsis cladophorae]KAI6779773.1 hypothetical protein J7T54_005803 [Emericellopsis cladophorae]
MTQQPCWSRACPRPAGSPEPVSGKLRTLSHPGSSPPIYWYERLKAEYTGQHAGETLPAGCDPARMARAVPTLNETESVETLEEPLETQRDDYTIEQRMLARVRELTQGHEACEMEQGKWAYQTCKRAGWSPFAEVRAVTLPYDDPNEACESFRAYVPEYFWICVCTMVNDLLPPYAWHFYPRLRRPAAARPLVPKARGMAWLLPDWGFRFCGKRYTLNPGPWTSKEQRFATIIFTGASSIGNSTGFLVLPLNRTLIYQDSKRETITPDNSHLATVTGSYGGMGFNPLSSWDPNVSGVQTMNSPFFAELQQYLIRVLSVLVILIMYYSNVLDDMQSIDEGGYLEYGLPY